MGKIIIQPETMTDPISLIGREAGVCWNGNTEDSEKNYKRGLDCIKSGHGRTFEFPQVYMILDGYSARVIREYYTHIGGNPTRVQASTRYIEYGKFEYVTPRTIANNEKAKYSYDLCMSFISRAIEVLEDDGIPKEDAAMLLPLGMETKVVVRTNLRNLLDMANQRLCTRAYWEYRELMRDIMNALSEYSDEWKYLVENYFKPKCEVSGFCTERKSCGRKSKKEI